MICVSYSPICKIFQPYFNVYENKGGKMEIIETVTRADLVKNPARIFKEELFSIAIRRSCGDVHFISSRPKQVQDTLLRMWLCAGSEEDANVETDEYGIVQLDMDPDTLGALSYFVANPQEEASKGVQQALKEATEKAKQLSHIKAYRTCKRVFKYLKKQYELNEEMKLGKYPPSETEFLCSYVVAEESTRDAQDRATITEKFAELMKTVVV
jgi:hypothetical protein